MVGSYRGRVSPNFGHLGSWSLIQCRPLGLWQRPQHLANTLTSTRYSERRHQHEKLVHRFRYRNRHRRVHQGNGQIVRGRTELPYLLEQFLSRQFKSAENGSQFGRDSASFVTSDCAVDPVQAAPSAEPEGSPRPLCDLPSARLVPEPRRLRKRFDPTCD